MWRYPNKTWIKLSCLIYFFALNAHTMGIYGAPTVKIPNGLLEGTIMMSRLHNGIDAYQGIPYAAPPVGELRFKPPQPASAWSKKRLAVSPSPFCIQKDIFTTMKTLIGQEDCLYLNVYTPSVKKHSFTKLPVMVWFHGGGWISGGSDYYKPNYLLDRNIVLVTVNYRLGPLGFLSTEDSECPGNLGLKDQQQALRWVKENIAYFNGDPTRVTIFGESSGGASVHYHMVSPLSKGFFHRAISQSGTFYNPWTLMPPGSGKKNAETLAKHLKCSTENSKKLIECLRTKNAREITDTNHIFQILSYCPTIAFRPIIEPKHSGAFLIEDPLISVQEGRLANVPWLTGVVSQEGAMIASSVYGQKMVEELDTKFMKLAPLTLLYQERYHLADQNFVDRVTKDIRKYYFGKSIIDYSDEVRFNMINMYSDAWFTHGTYMAVRDFLAKQTSSLYFYYFSYKGNISFSSTFGDSIRDYGVSHADEIQYLFPLSLKSFGNFDHLTEDDKNMIDRLTTFWSNFAKFGNPSSRKLQWTPTESNLLKYLHIVNSEQIVMKSEFLKDRMLFWNNLENRLKSFGKNYRTL
ncbi:venom carboxylesterase-6-like [Linepithema humile]|uniref:venom carboxylesterase-6-like n=1 Tax=Linepithema humile TaxID=83485 RepID=UPI00351E8423